MQSKRLELEEVTKEVEKKKEQLTRLQSSLAEKRTDLAEITSQLDAKKKQLESLRHDVSKLNGERDEFDEEIKQFQKEKLELLAKKKELEKMEDLLNATQKKRRSFVLVNDDDDEDDEDDDAKNDNRASNGKAKPSKKARVSHQFNLKDWKVQKSNICYPLENVICEKLDVNPILQVFDAFANEKNEIFVTVRLGGNEAQQK